MAESNGALGGLGVVAAGGLLLVIVDLWMVVRAGGRTLWQSRLPELMLAETGAVLALSLAVLVAVLAARGRFSWAPDAGAGLLGGTWLALVLGSTRSDLSDGWTLTATLALVILGGAVGGWLRPWVGPGLWLGALGMGLRALPPSVAAIPAPTTPQAEGPSVLLITLDTFRADHLGSIGGAWHAPATPRLDKLASEGILYTEGVAPVALTLPSHTTMLTGLHPADHGLLKNGARVEDELRTLAHDFREQGYRTGAFVSSYVLRQDAGLASGFEVYQDRVSTWDHALDGHLADGLRRLLVLGARPSQRPGADTVADALDWLGSVDGPAFLWVHLYDAHAPYHPPDEVAARYDAEAPGAPGGPAEIHRLREDMAARGQRPPIAKDLRKAIANYAAEIEWVDTLVGRLLDGVPADTPVVVAADHGESLLEHGEVLNHGGHAYQSTLRVPIIVRAPGQLEGGQRFDGPVSLARVAPTLRVLARMERGFTGALVRDVEDQEIWSFAPGQASRFALDLLPAWRVAMRRGDLKWILSERTGLEHFDLSVDPQELRDLGGQGEGANETMVVSEARLRSYRETSRSGPARDREAVEALRALGYVE